MHDVQTQEIQLYNSLQKKWETHAPWHCVLTQHEQRHWTEVNLMLCLKQYEATSVKRAIATAHYFRPALVNHHNRHLWMECQYYLILVDSYSCWFEIDLLHNITCTAVITKLKRHFSMHGSPHKVISDNGTQFTSQQFKDFATAWDFIHMTSSPEYP